MRPSLTGTVVGRWHVLAEVERGPRYERRYACRCDCGTERVVLAMHLYRRNTQSCGCLSKEVTARVKRIDIARGERFGRLVVIAQDGHRRKELAWKCRCDCGAIVRVASYPLRSGAKQSCGCLHHDRSVETSTTHGQSKTPEYRIWVSMKNRCHNPKVKAFRNYGARGINVCERWDESFVAFRADMGPRPSPRHSIDRIDYNGNYSPDNCRWATPKEQANNSRRNRRLTHQGITLSLSQWSERLGIPRKRIRHRLNAGWPVEAALTP